MQIINNVQSPNFGMALKINKWAKKDLCKMSMKTIQDLQKAGEELKDTKYYHVVVDNNLEVGIKADKDAYFGPFKTKDYQAILYSDNDLRIRDNTEIYSLYGVSRMFLDGSPNPIFCAWGPEGSCYNVLQIKSLTKIVKILDDAAVAKYAELDAKMAEQAKVSGAVDKLLDTFGE